MTSEFTTLLSALKTVKSQTAIDSSYKAMSKDWPLPAVVLDMENPVWEQMTEDGVLVATTTRVSLLFVAEIDEMDATKSMKTIETNCAKSLIEIAKAFPNNSIEIDLPQYGPVPFGKTQIADSLGFFLRITDGE